MAKQEKKPGESLEAILRRFKRQVKNEGTLQELRKRERYEKPSEVKKRRAKAAVKRTRTQQRQDDV